MSATTNTANAEVIAALAALPALVQMVVGGRLATVNTELQTGVANAQKAVDEEFVSLAARITEIESSNPLVGPALNSGMASLAAAGITIGTPQQLLGAVQAGADAFLSKLAAAV